MSRRLRPVSAARGLGTSRYRELSLGDGHEDGRASTPDADWPLVTVLVWAARADHTTLVLGGVRG